MKIGTLISVILMIIGAALELIIALMVFNGDVTGEELIAAVQLDGGEINAILFLSVFWLMVIFFFITVLTTKKLFMILSAIFGILGVGGLLAGMLFDNWITSTIYILSCLSLILTTLFMIFGCIQYRAHNKIAIITSILLFLVVAFHNLYMGLIWPSSLSTVDLDLIMNFYLITYLIQSALFILHGLVLSFSKKDVYADDGAEDIMSVETGGAFASYVPSGGKKKMKSPSKSKKKKSKDAYSFDF